MLPCEDVRQLAEEYVDESLEPSQQAEVARHLHVCPSCHRVVEETRLARRVLHDADAPPPPPRLADRIKAAAVTRLSYRPRPLHERALGSPAFLATLASVLCGAVICLMAILRVAYIQPWPPAPPDVTVVETFRLPARDRAPLPVTTVAVISGPARPRAAARHHHSLVQVTTPARVARVVTPPPPPAPAPRPSRALMAVVRPSPTMGETPHLPTSTVTLAGVRISQPGSLTAALEPAARSTRERLDLVPATATEPAARGDLDTGRQ